MAATAAPSDKTAIFEQMPVPAALAKMAVPTVISQLITLIYNMADTWFIGRTNNPYMVAACGLSTTIFMLTVSIANLFGVGGGTLAVRLLGSREEDESRRVASLSLTMAAGTALAFSLLCLVFMDPMLRFLGASENTLGYARQYLMFVVVLGSLPTVLSNVMSAMLRNVGYSREAGLGLGMGGLLNVALDPLFMFVLLPDGCQIIGAAAATLLSNVAVLVYFIVLYRRVAGSCVLELPKRIEKISSGSMAALFAVGIPAAVSILLFDVTNMVINRLASSYGDFPLAAIGIVLKVERLPLNIGVGIGLGMVPLVAYNFASGDRNRMQSFFTAARVAGIVVAMCSVGLYYVCAPWLIRAFIAEPETVSYGITVLRARCFATPFMFLSFNMVHFMQAVGKGKVSFWLAAIRQLCLNIPMLFVMNHFFGLNGIVWTQMIADCLNVIISYIIYFRVIRTLSAAPGRK